MDFDKTVRYSMPAEAARGQLVTIFDADCEPYTVDLMVYRKAEITFGRDAYNDIVLKSPLVSREKHGSFVFQNGFWYIRDNQSRNGIICNDRQIRSRVLSEGDFYRIDDGYETVPEGVLFVISSAGTRNVWNSFPMRNTAAIGRASDCDIILKHVSVSQHHALITREGDQFYLSDTGSTNGVIINGMPVRGRQRLHEKDVIVITNTKLIFTGKRISYCTYQMGVSVDASDIVIIRRQRRKKLVTCNHVVVSIRPGELVSLIGGSGAGKSTVLNALSGYLEPAQGSVHINGVDLYRNFDNLKRIIGYVPQSDIVYDNLTLYDMLSYTARLRLPKDISAAERDKIILRAIALVELTEKKDSLIRSFSGGQRKRASIAVELLSDPNLLFLDEPASGLDPGTERNLMHTLRNMADNGKTVILVTHSTLQLKLCDKILFMGRGGRLCFCGSYDAALQFFGVSDIVDVYNLINDEPEVWEKKYRLQSEDVPQAPRSATPAGNPRKDSLLRQLGVLCARYFKLIINDRQRLLLLLAQAPVLAALISIVANGKQFEQYEMTKSLLFALSCSAFWIGMLNAIQEVCKERVILRREYMTGLRLDSYILSKTVILGFMCAFQSLLVTGVFALLIGLPEEGVILPPFAELLITTFLTALASVAMGLFVSCLFTNPDRAMTVAPILLMPQILFSGLIFKLDGATEILSWAAICRWSMEGYGTTANLNDLQLRLQQEGVMLIHVAEDFFTFTVGHLLSTWGILIAYTVAFLLISGFMLRRIKGSTD